MNEAELLARLARTLKRTVGPAVEGEYPKTQAYMSAVVLEKLARQLELADEHAAAEGADLAALLGDLEAALAEHPVPAALGAAVEALALRRDAAARCALVSTLYAEREALGEARFDALLARVRRTLGADLARRMVYSK